MRAFGVEEYGPIDNLCQKDIPKPTDLAPRDLLVQYASFTTFRMAAYNCRIKAVSVNPVDTKVRNGTYDDYPGQFSHPPCRKLTYVRRLL